jgi:hypothetical protein
VKIVGNRAWLAASLKLWEDYQAPVLAAVFRLWLIIAFYFVMVPQGNNKSTTQYLLYNK